MTVIEHYWIILALAFVVCSLPSVLLQRYRWGSLITYVQWAGRGRRASSSKTPPRSLSPDKKDVAVPPVHSPGDFKDIFPPSSRDGLGEAGASLREDERLRIQNHHVNKVEFRKRIIPFEADYRSCGPSTYTSTEISIEEVEALGDFPNYAKLAGIPLPNAYRGFRLDQAIPRPYRPFRWAYHQTMSLMKMETDWWLELTKDYASTIAARVELFEKHGKLVLDHLPGSELAAKELMEMALQFYCARYPHLFSLEERPGDGHVFINSVLNTTTIIKDHHPFQVLLHNVAEDFAIMLRNPADGCYYFRAGILCSALGWNVSTKLGLQLKEIHAPIPDYKEKMEFSMDRYFSKLPCDRPIQRGSWGLEVDTPLFMPPGDPHEEHRSNQDPGLPLSRINLRVDWQTLRRLPISGAIIFNFKALFTPMEEFRDEAYVPALLRRVLLQGKKNIMEYKSTWHVEHMALPALEKYEKEQVEKGMTPKDWEVQTLEESPWFPDWQKKWHRQQGF